MDKISFGLKTKAYTYNLGMVCIYGLTICCDVGTVNLILKNYIKYIYVKQNVLFMALPLKLPFFNELFVFS
jgi:hypothetical protein